MNLISKNIFLISILIISGCSSLDSLRFWQNDKIDPDEPKKLNSFSSQRDIKILWKNSFKGENDIGNFLPDFNAQKIFFGDSSGNVSSINPLDGNKNCFFCDNSIIENINTEGNTAIKK